MRNTPGTFHDSSETIHTLRNRVIGFPRSKEESSPIQAEMKEECVRRILHHMGDLMIVFCGEGG